MEYERATEYWLQFTKWPPVSLMTRIFLSYIENLQVQLFYYMVLLDSTKLVFLVFHKEQLLIESGTIFVFLLSRDSMWTELILGGGVKTLQTTDTGQPTQKKMPFLNSQVTCDCFIHSTQILKNGSLQNYAMLMTKCRCSSVWVLIKGFSKCHVEDDVKCMQHFYEL